MKAFTMKIIILYSMFFLLSSCGAATNKQPSLGNPAKNPPASPTPGVGDDDQVGEPGDPPRTQKHLVAVAKLRQFCASCHAIQGLKFIRTDDDQKVWEDLFVSSNGSAEGTWAFKIIQTLDWEDPTTPPDFESRRPSGRDWMPKGAKRLYIAEDLYENQPVTEFLRLTLEKELDLRFGGSSFLFNSEGQ